MISSAVLVPEELQPQQAEQPNGSLKRRQSSISEASETSKRPRLDPHASSIASSNGETSPTAADPATTSSKTGADGSGGSRAMSPPQPRRRQTSNLEQDKSRNRRLFGALLGTLSQSSQPTRRTSAAGATASNNSKAPLSSRREEIESRQRERLKRESDEIAESARLKKQRHDRARRREQLQWDEDAMGLRHKNMRAMARFLKTKAEPPLFYKPWQLRDSEEDEIKQQLEDVEAQIEREARDFAEKKKACEEKERLEESKAPEGNGKEEPADPVRSRDGAPEVHQTPNKDQEESEEKTSTWNEGDQDQGREVSNATNGDQAEASVAPSTGQTKKQQEVEKPSSNSKSDEHDHGGEELERGQEDDVIY